MSLLSRLAVRAARAYGMLAAADKNKVVADYLVVAGGGSGGNPAGGGGGAGGLLTSTTTLSTLNTYSITVGAGGAGVAGSTQGNNGSNSVLSGTGLTTITSIGGGCGQGGGSVGNTSSTGGSGGGGGANQGGAGSAGTSGQGNAGGSSNTSSPYPSGGGGGASAAGGNGTGSTSGAGGAGTSSSISGSSVTYAGGGGGAGTTQGASAGAGGSGGGGAGSVGNGTSGTANTGGGGGGAGNNASNTSGSGGSGIVIISYTATEPKFVGGTITTSGGKQIHTFTSSGTLSPVTPITASYLVVAGGGGGAGAANGGGAGGAGGYQTSSTTIYSGATYVVTVGAGGTGGTSGTNGSDSVLSGTGITTVTSIGGGRANNNANGSSGGSGGGASSTNGTTYTGGAGTSGQGFAGGNSVSTSPFATGGGGGASAVGANGSGSQSGNGGAGTASSISGTSVTYAGGGGGGATSQGSTRGTGGAGGGGDGGASGSNGVSGTPNLGGGGGGGSNSGGIVGGNGGSGIVIISYAGSQVFNGGLVTTSGGNTIHTFTSTGALTPLTNNLNNSLRFRGSNSAYLNRTPTVAGNRKTWTWSAWIKLGTISVNMGTLFIAQGQTAIYLNDGTYSSFRVNGAAGSDLITSMMPRDPSAWYHLVVACDTTQAVEANRLKIYVNGVQQTAFQAGSTYPTLNGDTYVNSTAAHYIGRRVWNSDQQYDGYMTDINFIDGQALEPYYFGNNDANGVWKPIQYKGTYGTNGFYLTFGNTTSTTTLGYDSSPNGNNWTTNNISLTAGTTYDAMTDVPTNTSATVANYCVWNPLRTSSAIITNANLTASQNTTAYVASTGTFGVSSGKWYWESYVVNQTSVLGMGITNVYNVNGLTTGIVTYQQDGTKYLGSVNSSYGSSFTTNDIIGFALDMDAGTLTCYKNNVSQGVIETGLSGTYYPYVTMYSTNSISSTFGQRPFSYTPPTGYVALNTYNLPTPTILQGNKYMDATLYTGNGSTQAIVNQGLFKPDLVWMKNRGSAQDNTLLDSVRGTTNFLISNWDGAETTAGDLSVSYNSNGFSAIGANARSNASANTYVGWQWQAGQGSTSSNTSGSVTSTTSVNTTSGFSIVTYTGPGSGGGTVGHGLGVAPKMIIVKNRNAAESWRVGHAFMNGGTNPWNYYMNLNGTAAQTAASAAWNNTAPTSTVFSIANDAGVSGSGNGLVAYCFAEIAGFSKFGFYTGNGSSDGPFIFLGFRPKFFMWKRTDTTINPGWTIIDSTRNPYNYADLELNPNSSAAEGAGGATFNEDLLSNGLKFRNPGGGANASGGTYIYAAFAEHPFKNSNAR